MLAKVSDPPLESAAMRNLMQSLNARSASDAPLSGKAALVLVLAFALLLVQSTQLLLHLYDHSDHHHHNATHSNYELGADLHSDELVEIEFAQDGFAKQLSTTSLVVALFAVVFLLSQRLLTGTQRWRIPDDPLPVSKPFSLRPPQRAPPH